ncbi:MAG: coproporphyrinogen III oxidase, partial [Bacteroidales bacterium]|nr:coproporphyrinogen III oxidase [Bacteroidales bacterium]
LDRRLRIPIQHLSCYALTPEENSILYKQIQNKKHAPVDDEQAARQYNLLLAALPHSPLQHYEVSNFAIPGFESQHNASYWDHTPYLGLGPSAHSFDGHSRQWNPSNLKQYIANIAQHQDCEDSETLTPTDLFNETILLGLRTRNGIDLDRIERQFGREHSERLLHYFTHKVRNDFYEQKESRLRLTEAGLWFADGIAADAFVE